MFFLLLLLFTKYNTASNLRTNTLTCNFLKMKELLLVLVGAIIAGVFAGIFTIVGALITYFFSMKIAKHQEYNKAAAIFRSAFSSALRTLAQVQEKSTYQILIKDIHAHEIAMLQFEPYLPKNEQKILSNAWEGYICSDPDKPWRINMNEYSVNKSTLKNIQDQPEEKREAALRLLAKLRINKLLDCAKLK